MWCLVPGLMDTFYGTIAITIANPFFSRVGCGAGAMFAFERTNERTNERASERTNE
jgi:hypothetical protein